MNRNSSLDDFIKHNDLDRRWEETDWFMKLIDEVSSSGIIDALNDDGNSDSKKIIILHAINSKNKLKKGNKYFEKSLSIIEAKYSNKVEIIRTIDKAYSDHIKNVKNCKILLDQVYAYDQGYNALEAMAMGK